MKSVVKKNMWLVAMLLMLVVAQGATAATVKLGYCSDEIKESDYQSMQTDVDEMVFMAIRFTSAQLSAYNGAKITKIRFGAKAGMTNLSVWVTTKLGQSPVASKQLSSTVDGWNEVTLDEPYVITGEDVCVGFNGMLPAGGMMPFNGEGNANSCWIGSDDVWDDYSQQLKKSLTIQAVVETNTSETINDISVDEVKFDSRCAKKGDIRTITVTLTNLGNQTVTMPVIHYQIGNMPEKQLNPRYTMRPATSSSNAYNATIDDIPEGMNEVKLWIDDNDDNPDNNSATTTLCGYTKSYPRRMLVEQFTTIQCSNCPIGDKILDAVVGDKDNVSWVAHHAGFEKDEFTLQASKDLLDPFGINSAPTAMFDRFASRFARGNKPALSLGYTTVEFGKQSVWLEYVCASEQPSFVQLNIKSAFDEATRKLTVTVSGEKDDDLFKLLYNKTALTVYLTEDNVTAKQAQKGATENVYDHEHVLRKALTASYGDALTWNGDTFSATYETTIDESWKPADMKVVAFVNRPYDGDATQAEVLNTAEVRLDGTSAINGVADNAADGVKTYYTLDGQQVPASQLKANNVYILRTASANGTTAKKVTVK